MIIKEIKNQIAFLKFDRPDKYHSFIKEMAVDLQEKLDECKNDDNIRCIVITAEGKAFCAGQDLSEATDPNGPSLETIVNTHYNPIVRKIRSIEKPIIAAVNGVAAGAGASAAVSHSQLREPSASRRSATDVACAVTTFSTAGGQAGLGAAGQSS